MIAACTGLVLLLASGQTAVASDGYDAQTRQAVYDGSGLMTVQGPRTLPRGAFHLGLSLDYARNPVVLHAGGQPIAVLVRGASTAELGVAYGLPARLQVGIAVPYAFRSLPNPYGSDLRGATTLHGLGDLRAELKYEALPAQGAWPGIGLALSSTLPTGSGQSWLGAGVAQPSLALLVEKELGRLRMGANAGLRLRLGGGTSAFDVNPGHAFVYRAGVGYAAGPATVMVEAFGAVTPGGPHPREANVGVRLPLFERAVATAGLGYGFSTAVGTPSWRFFGAVAWALGGNHVAAPVPPPPPERVEEPPPRREPDVAPAVVVHVTPATEPPALEVQPEPSVEPEPLVAAVTPPPPEPLVVAAPAPAVHRVTVTREKLELTDAIHFITASAKIHIDSYGLLDEVASALKEHPEITLLQIEGHTDNVGPPKKNLNLSAARAKSVLQYLVNKGIAKERLSSRGFGQTKPLASNQTAEGRAQNRRVEFQILKQ